MSLANLQRRAPSVKRQLISVDNFIDNAEFYARGQSKEVCFHEQPKGSSAKHTVPLKRATFTLGDKAIAELSELSSQTGIAKSRLIRILLDNQRLRGNIFDYIASNTK
ncbi:MAG: hypothetical protein ACI88A_001368 [Paraglaciecola sp.]|jgi:hypothetical protein